MPTSRAKNIRRHATTKARSKPTKNAARRKRRVATRRQRTVSQAAPRKHVTETLPGWRDLTRNNERNPSQQRASSYFEEVSTRRFALLLLAIATAFTLYVGHVHATQDLVAEVQQARRDNLRLHLKLNRLKGEFDQATGPSVIYRRARELGLEEGIAYGPTILETGD